ncbi:unnamed protein product [Bemisia tabaci]|uniref:Transmembrane protein 179 n=1 Tax=Bemisia tabaci TaxID=7038 RepID=A0A9P0A9J8_BEMTA|nr:PREDICTED: transmembrane protein 179 [Bemisia tabaci]XP_018909168.1 PREDICTED: transmembrane protein 179 [Bemisia tabaci]XP_018909170.1 PREDICTED: transmembrane protein 179 [Bemisia tabaci]CAH0385908.1 unnamed protein product [Bemisia tabaci]
MTMPSNMLLLSQIAGYVIALILSLCITIPMALHQDEFRGHCLLFSTGIWQENDGQFKIDWASQAYCNFTIFVGVLLFVISAIQVYRMARFAHKNTDSTFLSSFADAVTCIVLCTFTLISALMITLGFKTWCNEISKRFPSCEIAAGSAFDLKDGIDTSGFYIELGAAQFGAWVSFSCWVFLSVCALLKLCRFHAIENMRVSMLRERQRLINEAHTSPKSRDHSLNKQWENQAPSLT